MNKRIFFYKLEDIKISSIPSVRKIIKYFNINKTIRYMNESHEVGNNTTISNDEHNKLLEEVDKLKREIENNMIKKRRYYNERNKKIKEGT
jgi:hypothetical protein